ncbi:guanine nucleotide binding protein, alpha subunit [Pisolithus sp. B1]|nr:guanine nucleotide binding protein, alpha subunit [Pisolithus sp. B1]
MPKFRFHLQPSDQPAMVIRTSSVRSQDDPLSLAIRPPSTETDSDRQARLRQEAEARRISEQIDEELKADRKKWERSKGDVKLLLLGQAESGKSTLQKQFQLMYSPSSIESERMSWRTVVYFNVVRSIKKILATLEVWDDIDDGTDSQSALERQELSHDEFSVLGPSKLGNQDLGPSASPTAPSPVATQPLEVVYTPTKASSISELRLRLHSLVRTEPQLADRLSGGVSAAGCGKGEVFVRSVGIAEQVPERPPTSLSTLDTDPLIEEVASMLEQLQDDIRALWEHSIVRALISKRKLKLDEWSEFFLNDIARISARGYIPSTDDILHARIQTMGVSEHVFDVDVHGRTVTWHLYDVGGARGQRHTWVPYFDDANAIIFVSPISAFDQYLEEDPRTNRIDDSLQLFTQICSNQLLKRVHLVLFLNKTDILRKKLELGLQVSKYILSYGERPNEYEPVVNYFRAHFQQVHRRNNENRRVLYVHLTNVTDTTATQDIIANVRDSIFRGYLKSAALV